LFTQNTIIRIVFAWQTLFAGAFRRIHATQSSVSLWDKCSNLFRIVPFLALPRRARLSGFERELESFCIWSQRA